MEDFLVRRSLMIFSISGNAPPQINRILSVFTVAIGVIAFFWLEPTGTSTVLPSRSFNSSCCTDSPLTSLVFEDDALSWIAEEALKRGTGARALRAILEEFMLDIMYEIPKDPNIGSVVVTRPYLEKKGGPLIQMRQM